MIWNSINPGGIKNCIASDLKKSPKSTNLVWRNTKVRCDIFTSESTIFQSSDVPSLNLPDQMSRVINFSQSFHHIFSLASGSFC